MKKLIITTLLAACTSPAFANIQLKIGGEYITPKYDSPQSLTVKLGQPSSSNGNKMVWKKGNAIITAEFRNNKLQEIYTNLFYFDGSKGNAAEQSAEMKFLPGLSYGVVNSYGFYKMPIVKIGNSLGRNYCVASHWINKAEGTIRYTIKTKGADNGSFYWTSNSTMQAVEQWKVYRKDTNAQGMGIIHRVGWINEPVNYDVKKCF